MKKPVKILIGIAAFIASIAIIFGILLLALWVKWIVKEPKFHNVEAYVMVYLTNEASLETLDYTFTSKDFIEINVIGVCDETPESQIEYVKKKLQGLPAEDTGEEWTFEVEDFRRVLKICFYRQRNSSASYTINALERRPDVYSVTVVN